MSGSVSIKANLRAAFRDYEVDGVPASGAYEPGKASIRNALSEAMDYVADAAASAVAGRRVFATIADRNAWSDRPNGAISYVEATSQTYRWSGAAWVEFDDPTISAADRAEAAAANAVGVGFGVDGLLNARFAPQIVNGATSLHRDGQPVGLNIPAGATGQNALVQVITPLSTPLTWAGALVEARLLFDVTDGYQPNLVFGVPADTPDGETSPVVSLISDVTTGPTRVVILRFNTDGNETALKAFFLIGEATTSGAARSIVLASLAYQVVSAPAGALTLGDRNAAAQEARRMEAVAAIAQGEYQRAALIRPDGLGQFVSPAAAMASIATASGSNRWGLDVDEGVYVGELVMRPFVDLIGRAPEAVLHSVPADPDDSGSVQDTETVWLQGDGLLHGLKVTSTGRYAVHVESGDMVKNGLSRIKNCDIRHLGLDNPSTWASPHAVGVGMSSGQTLQIEASRLETVAPGIPLFVHTNREFDQPSFVRLANGALVQRSLGDGNSLGLMIQPLGSRQHDTFELTGCVVSSDIYYDCNSWLPNELYNQPADRCEVELVGHSNSPAVFKIGSNARALRIESANTSTGTVEVSGSALVDLFGGYDARTAGGSLPGYAMGRVNVSGQPMDATRLGARLGDCTGAAKTLTVSIDGGAPVTVTFSANHTAQSNAVVLGLINAVLGATGTASLYDVSGRYRPRFSDEEETLLNATTTGIPFGSVVAFDGHDRKIRLMTAADDKSLFAGVAWEDIYPGEVGRVKTRGKLWSPDIRRADGTALTFGATFSIHATTPGAVIVGGTQGLMMAIRSDAVQVAK
ncbi:hypothetical protein ACFPIF_00145 [Brevundimonas faecalis]|uniref:hypothetical protein n=1 Tax=Brevundimonas faecalis TaxID=947378 RepID=UPI0036068A3D